MSKPNKLGFVETEIVHYHICYSSSGDDWRWTTTDSFPRKGEEKSFLLLVHCSSGLDKHTFQIRRRGSWFRTGSADQLV